MESSVEASPVSLGECHSCTGTQMQGWFGAGGAGVAERAGVVRLFEPKPREGHAGLACDRINDGLEDGSEGTLLGNRKDDAGKGFEVHRFIIS